MDKLDTNIVQSLVSLIGQLERIDALDERKISFSRRGAKREKGKSIFPMAARGCVGDETK